MKSLLGIGLVTFVASACGAFKTPKTPAEQAHAALATEGKKEQAVGHLDGSLAPVVGEETAYSGFGEKPLKFMGIADGHLCFAMEWRSQRINVSVEDFGQASVDAVRKVAFTFEARGALDYPADAAWPAHPTNQVQSVVLAENRPYKDISRGADGTKHTYDMLFTRIEVCGPAPTIGPGTKFVTITKFTPNGLPALYVWRVDGTVDSSLVTGAAPPTTPTPSAGADTSSSAPAQSRRSRDNAPKTTPLSEDLMTRITSDGRFTIFLKLLAASDYADKLAEGKGTYTLFLPTDAVLSKIGADKWLKDAKTVNRAVHSHIFGGMKTRAQIVDGASGTDGFVKLQNENGDYIKVTVANGTVHVGKKSIVVDPELTTSNAVIYVIDSSLY